MIPIIRLRKPTKADRAHPAAIADAVLEAMGDGGTSIKAFMLMRLALDASRELHRVCGAK